MRFFALSVSFECSGAFFSHVQMFTTWTVVAGSSPRMAQPHGSAEGTDGADAPYLLQRQVLGSLSQLLIPWMPHKWSTLTFYGAYGWRMWMLRELGGLGKVGDNTSGRLSGFWSEHLKRFNCSAAAALASSLYHCSYIYLRNIIWVWSWFKCSAAQIPAVSGYTLRSHLL